jgi:hypothetical protein
LRVARRARRITLAILALHYHVEAGDINLTGQADMRCILHLED